jgi:hypothetical protein
VRYSAEAAARRAIRDLMESVDVDFWINGRGWWHFSPRYLFAVKMFAWLVRLCIWDSVSSLYTLYTG